MGEIGRRLQVVAVGASAQVSKFSLPTLKNVSDNVIRKRISNILYGSGNVTIIMNTTLLETDL